MAKTKTTWTGADVSEFLETVPNDQKRDDSHTLIGIFSKLTGHDAKMWGPSIIGFGKYHYRYESGHEGDAPITGFSPRKDAFALYLSGNFEGRDAMLEKLGKYKATKGCVYVKRLSDIDVDILKQMISASVKQTRELYEAD